MNLCVIGAVFLSAPAYAAGEVPPDYLMMVLALVATALVIGFLSSSWLFRRLSIRARLLLTLPITIAAFLVVGWVVTGGGETILRLIGR